MRHSFLVLAGLLALLWYTASPAQAQRVVRAALAVSPDGATVATSTGAGTLLLWDADTWTLRRSHTDDGTRLFGFDFAPDGRHIAFGTQRGRLVVLEVATGAVAFEVQDRTTGSVSATRFSPDGRFLFAAGQGRTLTSYDWRTGEALRTYDLGRAALPDGRPLDVEDFEVVRRPSGDLQLFIARFDGQARLMDAATGEVVHTWRNKARPRDGARNVKDVAVLPGASTGFFAGVGGDVIAVDLDIGVRLDSVQVHPDFVSDLARRADGRLLAATDLDGYTTLIDTETLSIARRMKQDASFPSGRLLFAVAFRPNADEVITGGIRLPLIVWKTSTGDRVRVISALP
jgi:WD40 repeat protein